MQRRHHHFDAGSARLFVDPDRDPAAVVGYADAVVNMDCNVDLVTGSCEGLVYTVVNNLKHQVV
jgi:hypothetical protein